MPFTAEELKKVDELTVKYFENNYNNQGYFKNKLEKIQMFKYFVKFRVIDTWEVLLGKKYAVDFDNYNNLDNEDE